MCAGVVSLSFWRVLFLLLLVAAGSVDAGAARYAVLVGVSAYPKTSGAQALPGAANDVRLLQEVLLRHGFARSEIAVVADGVPGAIAPTRENIMRTLRAHAARAHEGDFFFIHFSGHGSQQPVDPKRPLRQAEPDGFHEIFLPIDIGKWDGARSTVMNAIVDYELDELLDAFLEKGAFVWATFDACHSASLMRGGGAAEEVVLRHVSPRDLGVPDELMRESAATAPATRGTDAPKTALRDRQMPATRAGFVAFYAAETTEPAPEMPMPASLPAGHPDKHQHGVLAFTLAEAIDTQAGATYRQLAQFILSRYSSQYISNKPTPVFSGSQLDAVAFGATGGSAVRQWRIANQGGVLKIPTGLLAQVNDGSTMVIVRDPLARTEAAIASAVVAKATLFESELTLVPEQSGSKAAPQAIPNGAYARLVRPAMQTRLRVAQPLFKTSPPEARQQIQQAIEALRADPASRIDWQPAGRPAEVRLHEEEGQLWLLPASGTLVKTGPNKTPSIALSRDVKELSGLLAENLTHIGKTLNLVRLAEKLPQAALAAEVEIKLRYKPRASPAAWRDFNPAAQTRLEADDEIGYIITNRGRSPVDVTLLYVDSAFGIDSLFPRVGENNRVEAGGVLSTEAGGAAPIKLNDTTVGTERLLFIVASIPPQGERVDYSYLAQPRLPATRTADASTSMLQDLLDEAAFGVTRRSAGRAASEQAMMRVFTWQVIARKK